jgi:hypothetical protein
MRARSARFDLGIGSGNGPLIERGLLCLALWKVCLVVHGLVLVEAVHGLDVDDLDDLGLVLNSSLWKACQTWDDSSGAG